MTGPFKQLANSITSRTTQFSPNCTVYTLQIDKSKFNVWMVFWICCWKGYFCYCTLLSLLVGTDIAQIFYEHATLLHWEFDMSPQLQCIAQTRHIAEICSLWWKLQYCTWKNRIYSGITECTKYAQILYTTIWLGKYQHKYLI